MSRERFERLFPVPRGTRWVEARGGYSSDHYDTLWTGWLVRQSEIDERDDRIAELEHLVESCSSRNASDVDCIAELVEALEAKVRGWRAYRFEGYAPPEDGSAAEYDETAVHDCADQLEALIAKHKGEA